MMRALGRGVHGFGWHRELLPLSGHGNQSRAMDLELDASLASAYSSRSQRARVLTEGWLAKRGYCPSCGSEQLRRLANNNPAADFACAACAELFELKSGARLIGAKVVDGAYSTMVARIRDGAAPNLLLSRYCAARLTILDAVVVPRHFLTESAIERRKPLSPRARRAGWVGCNILMAALPEPARIHLVSEGVAAPRDRVLRAWKQCLFLREAPNAVARGWLVDVMACIDEIGRTTFTLAEAYAHETRLRRLYPGNANIRPKIRQQLQRLRDVGYLRFLGNGVYERVG